MSFILDALRKSEDERQRDAAPSVTRIPMAVPRDRLPRWAMTVMAALGISVLALGGAWWSSQRPERAPSRATAPSSPPAAAEQAQAAVAPPVTAADVPVAVVETPLAIVGTASEPPRRQESTTRPAAGNAGVDTAARAATSPTRALPSLGDLRAQGIVIPSLDLQLHSFSDAAERRFVFINGARYGEGELVAEDLRVVAIRPEGAVLSRQGREFLLALD